jgi:hypothetical protein
MSGATSFTVTEIPAVVEPPELDAVTMYVVAAVGTVGVPEILPVVASIASPAGSAGLIE